MAKYKIIPSSRTIVHSPISIGHKAENGVEAIEFDLTAWVETYGSGTLTVIMRRWGDAIPYPIALEIGEDNKATWTLSDIDTAKAGMAYAQLNYIVGDEVVKKSDIYTFRVMDSLTGEGEPPEAYDSWLEHLTHLAAEAMAEVLDIEGIVTDKTLTVDGGIADAKAAGDALALKADKSTTYTKTEVDQMIEDVEVETDTTLEVAGAAADAAETGRQIGLLKADLKYIRTVSEITNSLFEKGGWSNGSKGTYRQANRARTATKLYALKDFNISKNDGSTSIIYTEFYKQDGTVNRTVTWSAAIYIEKGSIFTLTVTPSNSGTAAETDIETILAGVTITGLNKNIILSTEDAFTTLQGIPTSTNLLIRHDYASRITITDYFKTGEKFLYVDCDSGYKFFVVAYDSNFNVVLYGSGYGNGWETGQVFKDYSKYAYVRFALSKQNDETISVDEISHLKISQNASENINRWSLISIAKDGINDSNKDYAPKYPKSSLISLKKAYERGFRDIALHVQVTSDNIPVVFHDQSINRYARNADGSAISGTVNISTSTLAKLDTYDFGIMFDEQYRGTKITRLEDALKLCKYLGVKIWIEPSVGLGDAKETLVFDMIKQYGLDDKMAFFSYYVSTLSRVHGKVPESDLYYWPNAVTDISTNIDALKALIDKNNVYVFTYAETAIPEETRLAMKNAGIRRIVQVLEGTEPNNIESALVSNLDCDGVESQVVPAYMAALKLT